MSYFEGNNLENKKKRRKWIKNHKKFIYSLNPNLKFIMLILYNNRSLFSISTKLKLFQYTWVYLNRQFKLLEDMGFIEREKIGRRVKWTITKKGDNFCKVLLRNFN